jgi:hypothetical protein
MKRPTKEEENIGYKINYFYCEKHKGNIEAAAKEVRSLKIKEIEIKGDTVEISLARPGLLIGRRGKNINALSEVLGMKTSVVECFHWEDIIVPLEYDPADFF